MRNHHMARAIVFMFLLTTAIQAASAVGPATYDVRIDTSSLVGHPAGPFYLFLAVTDGSGLSDGNNQIMLTNISFADGAPLGNPSSFGGVQGELESTVNVTDTATLNFFSEAFSAGQSLTFKLTATNNVDDGPIPDGFVLYILDNSGQPVPTLAPGSDYLFSLPMGVTNGSPVVFAGDPSRSPSVGNPMSLAAPVVTLEDIVPPETMAQLVPQPNTAGWNNTNVTVTLSSVDNPGGTGVKQITYSASGAETIASTTLAGASTSFTISTEGITTITFFGTDNAGNVESAKTLTIQLDKTPPTISGAATPAANANGWNNTNVTVSFQCADSLSGLAAGSPPTPTILSSEGAGQSVTGTCTDVAGNSASATVSGISIDKTPPTISGSATPSPNANGWNNTNVAVSFQCSDSLSGLAAGSPPPPTVLSTEGVNQSVSGTCQDLAGNFASATVSGINIDKTPPAVTCGASPSILWPPNNKLAPINVAVTVTDSLSGPAGFNLLSATSNEPDSGLGDVQGFVSGAPSVSGQLRAQRLGSGTGRVYTFNHMAMDRAGNSAPCATTVIVPHDQGH